MIVRLPVIPHEEALGFLIEWLRKHWLRARPSFESTSDPGFQFSIRSVIQERVQAEARDQAGGITITTLDETTNTAPFILASWELVRRGYLSPGMIPREGALRFPGDEFRITPLGAEWIEAGQDTAPLPTELARFARHLLAHAHGLRPSYAARAAEAVRAYAAGLHLSCCVMCGAAAESILLSLAIARVGDEERVLADYQKSGGTAKLLKALGLHSQPAPEQRQLESFYDLIRYWRDEAAHAGDRPVADEEAFGALALLLRLARYADTKRAQLTQSVA